MSGFSQVPPEAVRKHQANNSSAKNAYLFSKTQRFPPPNPECKNAFYSYDSQLSNRRTSLGYGQKSDFTKPQTCSPAATKYNHKSLFEDGKTRGKSFALSRDRSPDRSYLIPQLNKMPGPGQYENQVKTKMTISFSLRPKTYDFLEEKMTYKNNPGPGSYQDIDLDPESGRFKVSKYSDTKFAKINAKPPRFQDAKDSPSPLSYLEGDSMSTRGKYVLSQRKGRGSRPFDTEVRKTFTDSFKDSKKVNPGPGSYDKPSDFGIYGQLNDAKMKATIG